METPTPPRKMPLWRRIGVAAALLFMLVGLPVGSLLYLQQGFDYRKTALDELASDYGKMPDLNQYSLGYGTMTEPLRGNLHLVGWIDTRREKVVEQYGTTLKQLYQQFGNSSAIQFTTFQLAPPDVGVARNFVDRFQLRDSVKVAEVVILQLDEVSFGQSVNAFGLSAGSESSPQEAPLVALVDSSLTIRHFYNLERTDDIQLLVKHMATIIPAPPEKDIIFQPKPEI